MSIGCCANQPAVSGMQAYGGGSIAVAKLEPLEVEGPGNDLFWKVTWHVFVNLMREWGNTVYYTEEPGYMHDSYELFLINEDRGYSTFLVSEVHIKEFEFSYKKQCRRVLSPDDVVRLETPLGAVLA